MTLITGKVSGPDEVIIAVMGPTGSGKSTFINAVSGSDLVVGDGLCSCTDFVGRSKTFDLAGRQVTLVDTPGFDDTEVSDTDILKMIALYLSTSYEQGIKLAGIIYMHRISDFRVGGTVRRNFNMFTKLCGDEALKNVVIVTNMWNEVDRARGIARERELATEDLLFKPAIDKGAQMCRHDNTPASGKLILHRIIHNLPLPLRIQQELVDEGLEISETAAGKELTRHLAALESKHRQDIAELHEQMEIACIDKDERAQRELAAALAELDAATQQTQRDRGRLALEYRQEKHATDVQVREAVQALDQQERLRAAQEAELARLRQSTATASGPSLTATQEAELARLRQRLATVTDTLTSERARGRAEVQHRRNTRSVREVDQPPAARSLIRAIFFFL